LCGYLISELVFAAKRYLVHLSLEIYDVDR